MVVTEGREAVSCSPTYLHGDCNHTSPNQVPNQVHRNYADRANEAREATRGWLDIPAGTVDTLAAVGAVVERARLVGEGETAGGHETPRSIEGRHNPEPISAGTVMQQKGERPLSRVMFECK